MLGNFSFGDYFKAEAIEFAWDLITQGVRARKGPALRHRLPRGRRSRGAVAEGRRRAEGPHLPARTRRTISGRWARPGPCGPCSEIHYDLGRSTAEPGREHEQFPRDGGGRFVEIWNLVFMQFDRDTDGMLTPLPRPSIDTGMGLERVAAVLQGKLSNYDTDLLLPIIAARGRAVRRQRTATDAKVDTALRIVRRPRRATAFLIHDGVVPSNEGRGYVLRKIMRRAMRNARMSGVQDPFLYKLTGFVAELMKAGVSGADGERAARGAHREGRRAPLRDHVPGGREGLPRRSEGRCRRRAAGRGRRSSSTTPTAWRSTSRKRWRASTGWPSTRRFRARWTKQRERARASWKGAEKAPVAPVYQELLRTRPHEVPGLRRRSKPRRAWSALVVNQQPVDSIEPGDTSRNRARPNAVLCRSRAARWATRARCQSGSRREGGGGRATVRAGAGADGAQGRRRWRRSARGDDVSRARWTRRRAAPPCATTPPRTCCTPRCARCSARTSSRRAAWWSRRLRFDFTHYAAMDAAELAEVERLVNEQILRNSAGRAPT